MQIKNIKIPHNLKISVVFVNSIRFLLLDNTFNKKYILAPRNCSFLKEDNLLKIKSLSNFEFKQFFNRVYFTIKNLNMVFKKRLFLKGLGYRMSLAESKKNLELKLGFSHFISLNIPDNIIVKVLSKKKTKLHVESKNKVLLGNFLDRIVSLRSPDSYKGKGFWYKYQKKTLKIIKKK
jgi:ribosomal protein L6P/L9E